MQDTGDGEVDTADLDRETFATAAAVLTRAPGPNRGDERWRDGSTE